MSEDQRERRKNNALSDEQIEQIKDQILKSIYEDIGRSIVTKILWLAGAAFAALVAWLTAKGYIKV